MGLWDPRRAHPPALPPLPLRPVLARLRPAPPPSNTRVPQVQKLLRKHGIVEDDASRRKKARDAAERVRLVALYQQTRGSEDQLEVMAGQMPELAGGAKQVGWGRQKGGVALPRALLLCLPPDLLTSPGSLPAAEAGMCAHGIEYRHLATAPVCARTAVPLPPSAPCIRC